MPIDMNIHSPIGIPARNTQWIFRRRPDGEVAPEDFEMRVQYPPQPGPGQVLVRTST